MFGRPQTRLVPRTSCKVLGSVREVSAPDCCCMSVGLRPDRFGQALAIRCQLVHSDRALPVCLDETDPFIFVFRTAQALGWQAQTLRSLFESLF